MLTDLALPKTVRSDLACITKKLTHICTSRYSTIDAVLRYVASASGKHLRALLVIIVFRSIIANKHVDTQGAQKNQHIALAVAVELMQLATLLHDDVIDNAPMRRGQQSVQAKWGNKDSILAGDLLYTNAFAQVVQLQSHQLNSDFTSITRQLITGELLQAHLTWYKEGTLAEKQTHYFDVINHKTACLFAFCARGAAYLAGENEAQTTKWGEYAKLLGMAFQITDDVLDFTASASGKKTVSDLQEGKVTLPMLLGFSHLSKKDQQALVAGSKDATYLAQAIAATGAFERSKEHAFAYCQQAQELCAQLCANKDNEFTALLIRIPDVIVNRNY